MVGGMEDLFAAKAAVESAKTSLAAERQPFNPRVPVGAMIETPSAAIMTQAIGPRSRFLQYWHKLSGSGTF